MAPYRWLYRERFKDGRCHSLVTKDSLRYSMIIAQVFAGTIHFYWPAAKNATAWNQCDMVIKHKTAYLKLLSLPLSSLPLFSARIKNTTGKVWFIMLFLFPTSAYWWRFILGNVRRSVRVNRCHHRTVYTHIIAKFIRSMSHSVTCSDLIGLLIVQCVLGFKGDVRCPFPTSWYDSLGSSWKIYNILWLKFLNVV